MKIVIACVGSPATEVAVHALSYDASSMTFSMPCPLGDYWLHRLRKKLESHPIEIDFRRDGATILFKTRVEAEDFESWLEESEVEAQRGYSTMRG